VSATYRVITLDGQQHGWLDEETVRQWYQRQYLRDQSYVLVWGANEWKPLYQIFDVRQWQSGAVSAPMNQPPPTVSAPLSEASGPGSATGEPFQSAAYTQQPSGQLLPPPGGYTPQAQSNQSQSFNYYQKPVVFASAWGLGIATIVGVVAQIITRVIHLLTYYGNGVYIMTPSGRSTAPPDVAMTAYLLYGLFVLVWIAAAIVCCFWLYRAYKNLRALGHTHTEFTPGWAIGYFFVPIVGLWKPYQVVSELWKKSDPSESSGGSAIVAFWWLCFLLLGFANWMGATLISARVPDAGFPLVVLSMIANIIAGILFTAIIIGVQRRQEERLRIINESPDQLTSSSPYSNEYSLLK
jgi:uncharacterized membrane protein (DUF485 family)